MTSIDIFFRQKCDTFSRSNQAVFELSQRFSNPHTHEEGLSEEAKLEKNKLIFLELTQGKSGGTRDNSGAFAHDVVCLWGNSTDLSLLIDMTEDDIKKLQSTGGEHLAATEKNILGNDLHKLADYVMTIKNGRIDFILDNAGMCSASRPAKAIVLTCQVSSFTVTWSTPTGSSSLVPVPRSSSTERRSLGSSLM